MKLKVSMKLWEDLTNTSIKNCPINSPLNSTKISLPHEILMKFLSFWQDYLPLWNLVKISLALINKLSVYQHLMIRTKGCQFHFNIPNDV
jgi:hypothetical protein